MGYETKEIMKKVLQRVICNESRIEAIRVTLCNDLSMPFRKVFEAIDWLNRGFITQAELKRVLE